MVTIATPFKYSLQLTEKAATNTKHLTFTCAKKNYSGNSEFASEKHMWVSSLSRVRTVYDHSKTQLTGVEGGDPHHNQEWILFYIGNLTLPGKTGICQTTTSVYAQTSNTHLKFKFTLLYVCTAWGSQTKRLANEQSKLTPQLSHLKAKSSKQVSKSHSPSNILVIQGVQKREPVDWTQKKAGLQSRTF